MQYNLVVCGGTFDRFHKGHKDFLRFILSHGKNILLGLTTDQFAKQKESSTTIEPYAVRKASVEKFFQEEQATDRLSIEPIDSIYIPQKWEQLPLEALIVSEDSKVGGKLINQKREENGLTNLPIIICPLTAGEDGGIISSVRIRNGEIDREGNGYVKKQWLTRNLTLPQMLREKLRKPFGTLIKDFDAWVLHSQQFSSFATVGDAISQAMITKGRIPHIAVVDLRVQRKQIVDEIAQLGFSGKEILQTINNPAGTIQAALTEAVLEIFKKKKQGNSYVIQIDGEDDLAVLPLLLSAPLGYVIYYGQPGEGVVEVTVTEYSKKKAYSMVSQFV